MLERDLHVGDLVLLLPCAQGGAYNNNGFAIICGQTKKFIRVIKICRERIVGKMQYTGPVDEYNSPYNYDVELHGGGFYLVDKFKDHPVCIYLRKIIKERT